MNTPVTSDRRGGRGGHAAAGGATAGPVSASRLAPPFLLPGAHFTVAFGFLVLGACGLVWVSPDLAAGRFLAPRVVAVTHLFTLGWITLSIFGSLYQFLPVALSEPIRWIRVSYLTLGLFAPGLLAFAWGLVGGGTGWTIGGATAFGAAIVLFCGNLAATLRRAGKRDLTWWALAAAGAYLFLTAVLGLSLSGNLRWPFMGAGRWPALGVHIHLALAGWVFMVVIGVGARLLPMFLLSHGVGEGWGKGAAWLVAVGVGLLVAFHHAPPFLAQWLPAFIIAAGMVSFFVQAALWFRHSVKPKLDPGLRLAGAALVVLVLGLALGGHGLATGWASGTGIAGYGAAVILGLSLFVAAHYYKIVPFLVWYHRFGPNAGRAPVPTVSQLYSAPWAAGAAVLLTVGTVGLVLAILAGAADWARLAAAGLTAGAAIQGVQMVALSRRRP
jgi:hypothetical protein